MSIGLKLRGQKVAGGYKSNLLVFLACFSLAFLAGSLVLLPSASDAASTDTNVDFNVSPVISLRVDDGSESGVATGSANMVATPGTNPTVGHINAYTSTNNSSGVTLTMAAVDDPNASITDTALTHSNLVNKIPSTTNTSYVALQPDTWGYRLRRILPAAGDSGIIVPPPIGPVTWTTNNSYIRIPEPSTPDAVLLTNAPSSEIQTEIYVGVNTSMATLAGTYTDRLLFTATANYVPPSTMQEISIDNCPTTAPNPSTGAGIYRDTRDNHYYAIQKLPDGKCWMLTNLAYGGTEAGVEFTTGAGTTDTIGDAATNSNWDRTTPPYQNQKQWVNPTNSTANGGNVVQGNSPACQAAFRESTNAIDYTECGYLYNWCAALGVSNTGGPLPSACSEDAANTNILNAGVGLCPAGWRLPTGGAVNTTTGTGEFQAMYNAIGGTYTNLVGENSTWKAPMPGNFYAGDGLLDAVAVYWTATNSSLVGSNSFDIYSNGSSVAPTAVHNKFNGYNVRCIIAQ